MKSPLPRVNQARHDEHLPLAALAGIVNRLLTAGGRFSIILPPEPSGHFQQLCAAAGLHPQRRLLVSSKPGTRVKRILTEYCRNISMPAVESAMNILYRSGKFTAEYLELTVSYHDF